MGGQGTAGQPGAGGGKTPVGEQPVHPGRGRLDLLAAGSARPAARRAVRPGRDAAAAAPRARAAAGRPSPTARCAACPRRGSTRRGRRRRAPVGGVQDVPTLAVGVVHHDVEHRQPGQLRVVGVGEQVRLAVLVLRGGHPQPAGRQLVGRDEADPRSASSHSSIHSWQAPRRRAGRRAAPSAGPRPSRPPRRPGRRPPRGRPACRPGSPTVDAPPAPACRRIAR